MSVKNELNIVYIAFCLNRKYMFVKTEKETKFNVIPGTLALETLFTYYVVIKH